MVIASPEEQTKIRRLFRFDETDRLVAMESTSRTVRDVGSGRCTTGCGRSGHESGSAAHSVRPVIAFSLRRPTPSDRDGSRSSVLEVDR
jgi:hypothetical protein